LSLDTVYLAAGIDRTTVLAAQQTRNCVRGTVALRQIGRALPNTPAFSVADGGVVWKG
jgi:hypothetical protein